MSQVWFTSDLHFGHENIGKFRKGVQDDSGNRARIAEDWFGHVSKRDLVWILGDVAFTDDGLRDLLALPGRKKIILGNHDPFKARVYSQHFETVAGLHRYRNAWLSHCPIHPEELRGKVNLHGHTHYNNIKDDRYFNCCVENCWDTVDRSLISLPELRELGVLNK